MPKRHSKHRLFTIVLTVFIGLAAIAVGVFFVVHEQQESFEDTAGMATELDATGDSDADAKDNPAGENTDSSATGKTGGRAYQNPPEYIQISNEISTHGLDYYVSPVLVDDTSTKEDHIEALIETAYKYEGDEFVYNQSGPPGEGVDCSGLIMQACYGAGVDLWPVNPARHREDEYSWECQNIAKMDTLKTVPYEDRQRGDLIFFSNSSGAIFHVSIYLGDNRIIHSTTVGYEVIVSGIGDGMFGDVCLVKRIFN